MFNGHCILLAMNADGSGHQFCRDVHAYGGEPLGPVAAVAEALDLLERAAADGAIVGEYLRDGVVAPLVLSLWERSIPFVLLQTSPLTLNLGERHRPLKVLWAWTSPFQVIRELEVEMEAVAQAAGKEKPGLR